MLATTYKYLGPMESVGSNRVFVLLVLGKSRDLRLYPNQLRNQLLELKKLIHLSQLTQRTEEPTAGSVAVIEGLEVMSIRPVGHEHEVG